MSPADINRLEAGHESESADCAIISLSVFLGVPYTDVIRIAARVSVDGGRFGLTRTAIKQIAVLLDCPLRVTRRFDPEDSYGIVWVEKRGPQDHCAVLRSGLVLDRLMVWEWADWLKHQKAKAEACVLLVAKDASC